MIVRLGVSVTSDSVTRCGFRNSTLPPSRNFSQIERTLATPTNKISRRRQGKNCRRRPDSGSSLIIFGAFALSPIANWSISEHLRHSARWAKVSNYQLRVRTDATQEVERCTEWIDTRYLSLDPAGEVYVYLPRREDVSIDRRTSCPVHFPFHIRVRRTVSLSCASFPSLHFTWSSPAVLNDLLRNGMDLRMLNPNFRPQLLHGPFFDP